MSATNLEITVPDAFTHLEVHSHYTLLGATPSIDDLVSRARAEGMSHLALTDSNALYGAVAFDIACREAGIRPILGMTIKAAAPEQEEKVTGRSAGKLTLIARDPSGYRSLCRLSSLVQGQKNRLEAIAKGVKWNILQEHNEGLLCLSGGQGGWIGRLLGEGNIAGASRYVSMLAAIYGENTFLSLEIHRPDDLALAQEIRNLGRRFGLPVVAVQPIFYLDPKDQSKLRLLKAIDLNCKVEAVTDKLSDRHWLRPEQVARRFADIPEALEQVGEITSRCGPVLPDGRTIFPIIKDGSKIEVVGSVDEHLAHLADEGMKL